MSFGSFQTTTVGREMLTQAVAGGMLTITNIQIGDGSITTQDINALTGLISPVHTVGITSKQVKQGQDGAGNVVNYCMIQGSFKGSDIGQSFYFREIGVMAKVDNGEEKLLCYNNAYDTADYLENNGMEKQGRVLMIPVFLGQATNIQVIINEDFEHVTMEEFEEHTGDMNNPHGVTAAQAGAAAADHSHTAADVNAIPTTSGAGAHNAVYRGKYLGNAVTAEQWAAIKAGTFDDLYIGDYWTIGGVNYRIAAFDYYYNFGDITCTVHHVTVVPDYNMYYHVMNDTSTTEGGYVGSKMYTEGLTQAKTTISQAFGSDHVLNHRKILTNSIRNGFPYGYSIYDSTVELMTEQNVFGCKIEGATGDTDGSPSDAAYMISNRTYDNSQFPLFSFRHDMIYNDQHWWLRDITSHITFAYVNKSEGCGSTVSINDWVGVRPAFSIYQA